MDLKPGKTRKIQAYQIDDSILIVWSQVSNCDEYELELDGLIYNTEASTNYKFNDVKKDSIHLIRIRAVADNVVSEWSEIKTIENIELSAETYNSSTEIDSAEQLQQTEMRDFSTRDENLDRNALRIKD